MKVFDRKGKENFNNHALRNPASLATDKLGTLSENVSLAWDVAKYQHLGVSESLNYREPIQNQFKLMYELTGNEQYNRRYMSRQIVGAKKKVGEMPLQDFELNKRFYEEQHDAIEKLQEKYPDAGLQTWSQMSEKRNKELQQMSVDMHELQNRSQTLNVAVGNVASMGAYFMDPELLATLPFSGGASIGGRIAANAWRSFKIESGLALVSETVIAPKVYDFQHQIGNEEYGVKDAVVRIMTATLGAGVIRAGGSVTIDLSKLSIAKAKLLKQGNKEEAHVLEYYAKLQEDAKTVEGFIHDASIAANTKEYVRPVKVIEDEIAALKKTLENARAVLSKRGLDVDDSITVKGRKKDIAEKELQLKVLIKEQQQYLLSRNNDGLTKADQFVSAHIAAQSKVAQAFEKGETVPQKEIDDVLGVDELNGGKYNLEKVDPNDIEVDAETFQYKSGGDEFGETDALKGVTKWDDLAAGTIIVWERKDGTRFVADGHQRLALAKRLIGEDAQEIGLNAFVMRETDGFSAPTVRDIAAFNNLKNNTGTALDAAKVLRSGVVDEATLSGGSALIRDAKGLSKLSDDSFRMVIDGQIDAKYGAIVGELVADVAEQAAIIRALAKEKPVNANQARIMVGDMKAAGFQKTETMDLFGGMEITETLFKERAKVIDSAMRQIKKDKSIFKTLAEQESRIAGAGNKLDRNANLLRLSDDEKTLATLTSLANAKGPVSDAINDAARRVKSGESIQRATRDILPELRRSTESELNARADADGTGDGQPTLTIKEQIDALPEGVVPLKVVPPDMPGYSIGTIKKDGKTITVVNIDRSKIDVTCKDFCYPELKPAAKVPKSLLIDTKDKYIFKNGKYEPKRAKEHEKYIDEQLANGTTAKAGEKPIVWLMGGGTASGKGTVLKKVQAEGVIPEKGFVHADPDLAKKKLDEFNRLSNLGDHRAASVVHRESSDIINELIKQAIKGKKNLIIDKTLGNKKKALKLINKLKADGYDVRLVGVTIDPSEALVRSLTRYFGSGRLVEVGSSLKRHKGFNANFEKYAKEVDEALLFDNTGTKSVPIARVKNGETEIFSNEGYNQLQARGKLNEKTTTHQELRESQGLPAKLDRPSNEVIGRDTGRVAEGGQRENSRGNDRSEQKPQNLRKQLDAVERQKIINDIQEAEGILAYGKQVDGKPYEKEYLDAIRRNVAKQKQKIAQDDELQRLQLKPNKANLNDQPKDTGLDLDQIKTQEAQKLIDELGDDLQMVSGVKDSGKGDVVLEFKTARESFKEIDNEQKLVDNLMMCVRG